MIRYYRENSCTAVDFDNFVSIDTVLTDVEFSKVLSYFFLSESEENNLEAELFNNTCIVQFQIIN